MSSIPGIDSRAPLRTDTSSGSSASPSFSCRLLLEPVEGGRDLLVRHLAGLHVLDARLGRDREAGGHALGAEHARHLGDVRALPSEQVAHVARALAELVDELVAHRRRIYATRLSRTCAWYSIVSAIARSAWESAARRRLRRLGQRAGDRLHEEGVRLGAERERAGLATGADHAARARREAAQVLRLAAGRAGGQLGGEPGRQQQLEAEGERLGPARPAPAGRPAARARCRAGCRRAGSGRWSRAAAGPPRTPGRRARARRGARAGRRGRGRCRPG